jgi:hypothetical protein
MIEFLHKLKSKFRKIDSVDYWFKFIMKFPERFLSGAVASAVIYGLIKLLGF